MQAVRDHRGGDRGAERDRAVRGDVGEGEDAIADVDAEGEEREDQADGPGGDEQRRDASPIGKTQHAPRRNSLSPPPSIGRSSRRRWTTENTLRGRIACARTSVSSTRPLGSDRNAVTAA